MEIVNLLVICLGGLGIICIMAIFEGQWRYLIQTIFQMIMSPVAVAERSLNIFWAGARQLFREQFVDRGGNLDLRITLYHLIGSLIYTFSFGLFVFADYHLMNLTLIAMGIGSPNYIAPMEASSLIVLALIAAVLFFGTLFLDLIGITEIAPWKEKVQKNWRTVIYIICILSLFLSILIACLAGDWRGKSISDDDLIEDEINNSMNYLSDGSSAGNSFANLSTNDTKKEDINDYTLIFINIAIPAVFILGGILSGWGIVEVFKFAVLLIAFILVSPTGIILLIFSYATRIIERVYEVVLAIIGLLAAMGRWFLGIFRYRPPYSMSDYSQDVPPPSPPPKDGSPDNEDAFDDNYTNDENGNSKDTDNKGFNPYE